MPLVRAHPHAEATYQVIPSEDGSFAAEVRSPDTQPTKVGPFETSADAEAWIAEHRTRGEAQSAAGSGIGNMRWAKKRQRQ